MGDAALGIITACHYDYNHDSAMNKEFVEGLQRRAIKRNPDFFSVGGYDGMHLIYEALKKTGGKTDGDSLIAAAKGMSVGEPARADLDRPETRDIVQTVYIRQVEKVGGELRQRRVRQGRERQGPGEGRDEEVTVELRPRWRATRASGVRGMIGSRASASCSTASPTGCCCSCCRSGCR